MRAFCMAVALLVATVSARADEVRLVASNAVKELVQELAPEFEGLSRHRLLARWGGTPDITALVEQGGSFDLVVIPRAVVADLELRGKLLAGGSREFVASAIGAAVSPGAPRYDVSSVAALRQSLLSARSIVLSSGPSSLHLLALTDQMGIREAVKSKTLRLAPGQSVGEALAQGRGELGFTQMSELLSVQGIDRLGLLGKEVQRLTVFVFGVRPGAGVPPAAKALITFLTSDEVSERVRHSGLDPR